MPAIAPDTPVMMHATRDAWSSVRGLDALAAGDRSGFASAMDKANARRSPEEIAREAAEEFVSMALIQPVLAQLRETNKAAQPFAPGDAERRFGFLLDAEHARRIAKAQDFPIVEAVARDLLRHANARALARGAEVDTHG